MADKCDRAKNITAVMNDLACIQKEDVYRYSVQDCGYLSMHEYLCCTNFVS